MRLLTFLSAILILLASNSCKKLKKDPGLRLTFSEITNDGVSIKASVENDKDVSASGFCFGTTSNPQAMSNYDIPVSINSHRMETVIPFIYFNSYTGYYIRPYARTSKGVFYGDEVYFPAVQSAPVTPACTPTDNYVNIGGMTPTETFYSFDMPDPNTTDYTVRANSNSHMFTFEFNSKLKTGIYTTSYGTSDYDKVHIYLYSGFISGSLNPGTPVYVNEVSQGKFEITLCNAPWKQGSSSTNLYMTAKVVTE